MYNSAVRRSSNSARAPIEHSRSSSHDRQRVAHGSAFNLALEMSHSQASHCPVHALVQHTPSTQLPERHCRPSVQVAPAVTRGTHEPLEHHEVATQSASAVHMVLQAPAAQEA